MALESLAQGAMSMLIDGRYDQFQQLTAPSQDQRQPFAPVEETLAERDRLAEIAEMQYHRFQFPRHNEHAHSYLADGYRRQSLSYETSSSPPVVTQCSGPIPALHDLQYERYHPQYEQQKYEPTPGAPREDTQVNIIYKTASNSYRRRGIRTAQACETCRATKAKCDDLKPCSSCVEREIDCIWNPPVPKPTDPVQAGILEMLRAIQQDQQVLLEKIGGMQITGASQAQRAFQSQAAGLDQIHKAKNSRYNLGKSPGVLEAAKALLPGELTIPVGHTTGAAKLLRWPKVFSLVREKMTNEKTFVYYPNILENMHGLRSSDSGPSGLLDDSSSDESSLGPDSIYNQTGVLTPPLSYNSEAKQLEALRGDVGLDRRLELNEGTVNQLVESYLANIHIMHPILDPKELRAYANYFTRTETLRRKRKWSQDLPEPRGPTRSIKNAMFFLVLALGKICEYREGISDLFPDRKFSRNPSVIPGIAYTEFATDILGNEIGENTLSHVLAFILASLYYGQLARPSYSHRLINNASLGLQAILQPKLEQLQKYKPNLDKPHEEKVPAKDNALVFAFWTCMQLEGDILAELDLPHSGITTLEMHMPWPNLEAAKAVGLLTKIQAESYQAQLYLRNHLNKIHQTIYSVSPTGRSLEEAKQLIHNLDYKLSTTRERCHFPVIEAMVDSIPDMSMVAPSMVWSDTDPLADDILFARLRAKYYGIQAITYRPFLKMVMNRPPSLSLDDIPPKILMYAKLCIKAIGNSTRAFYGMRGGRLIVANIWGTAHAQWGNVILLLTAYIDPILQQYVEQENLTMLLERTIHLLESIAAPTSALKTDEAILKFAAHKTMFMKQQELEQLHQ